MTNNDQLNMLCDYVVTGNACTMEHGQCNMAVFSPDVGCTALDTHVPHDWHIHHISALRVSHHA
jgi:hypothetical protein